MDVIAIVDPLYHKISPKHFNQYLAEPYSELFAAIKQKGAYSSFFVCGDATKNIELCARLHLILSQSMKYRNDRAKEDHDQYNNTLCGIFRLRQRCCSEISKII
jgi:uroporphyrinogen decarboxylase